MSAEGLPRVAAVVQCTFSNLLGRDPTLARRAGAGGGPGETIERAPENYVIAPLRADGRFSAIVLAVPDLAENRIFGELAAEWGAIYCPGPEYDVAGRLLLAARTAGAEVIARVLLHRFYLDTELVWRCVELLVASGADYVNLPLDFNINFGADVVRAAALERVGHLAAAGGADDRAIARRLFRPWHFMEERPGEFSVVTCEDVPTYLPERVAAIRAHPNWSERSRYGDDFPGSEYHVIAELLAPGDTVLDIACGYGESTEILRRRCARAVGVDRDPEVIATARRRFGDCCEFVCAEAARFAAPNGSFDCVVSCHTLEHVAEERRLLINLRNMLRPGGRLVLEVPLATPRPFTVPHNPHHLREYTREGVRALLARAGFAIEQAVGVARGLYTAEERAREAIQLRCRKPDAVLYVYRRAEKEIQLRANDIRRIALRMIHAAGSGHPGGSLSCAEVLACLYFAASEDELRVDWERGAIGRNRFVLSKGHACPAWYAALHLRGLIPEAELHRLRRPGALLQGHPDVRTPGVDVPSGSLGNGLSVALGVALGLGLKGSCRQVYVLLGDGDLDEGETWEALMAAAHRRAVSLTAILDANGLQGEGPTQAVMNVEPLLPRLEAFGWQPLEVDGHDVGALLAALRRARDCRDRPTFIVARTVKGKGVSFMEGEQRWHGSRAPSAAELEAALAELEGERRAMLAQEEAGFYAEESAGGADGDA